MGLVRSLNSLILTRIGVGVFRSPCFPANSRVSHLVSAARAGQSQLDLFVSGQYVGSGS